jgi:uncharacterized protein
MYPRLFKGPRAKKSFFLFGPRGTGKTQWVQSAFPEALYLDLLGGKLAIDLQARPGMLEDLITAGADQPVILDEVQRAPELLNEVHRLIEAQHIQFILTGSSARALRRRGVNLLAGRALTYRMHPLTAAELKSDFSLDHALTWGHLPATFSEPLRDEYLQAYVANYLREEVQQEGLVRSMAVFSRFLETASFSQASLLNMANIAREVGVDRKTVAGYFQILEDLLLATIIPVFTKRAQRKLVSHHKFYFFDAGVYRTIRPMGPYDRLDEAEGAALETLVYQELSALNDYLQLGYSLYFWRTGSGLEVDFVLYGKRGVMAIEVKRTAKIQSDELKGLRAFAQDYPEAKLYLFYCGDRRLNLNGVQAIPIQEAIVALPSLLGFKEDL